jgi:hypothetical protein
MIPQRRLNRNGYGNGVSCRVEACRKRLRIIRTKHAAQSNMDKRLERFGAGGANSCREGSGFVQAGRQRQDEGQKEAGIT